MSSLTLEGKIKKLFSISTASSIFPLLPERDAGRPKLKLAPRTVKDPVNALAETKQAAAIFGNAKPREEKVKDDEEPEAEQVESS